VQDFTAASDRKITPQKILETVSDFYNVDEKKLCSSSRKKDIVRPRQVAMYLMRERLETSYPSIAKHLGGKDHTTAMYAYNKISEKLENDESLQKDVKMLKVRFLTG